MEKKILTKLLRAVLMDLSKTFDCIPHDLVAAKLTAYGFIYIYSYLKSRKQGVNLNNIKSTFEEIISRVPQGSIVRPTLLNIFLNGFFYFIFIALANKFLYP